MQKIKLGLIFGGVSPEHAVSISSAAGVRSFVDEKKFTVAEIFIDPKGIFFTGRNILSVLKAGSKPNLKRLDLKQLSAWVDVVFPILHGAGGEDGTIQGLLQSLRVPFVGCDVAASAICLDKAIFNDLMCRHGMVKPKYAVVDFDHEAGEDATLTVRSVGQKFTFPLFVKPARTGSSVGISKVKNKNSQAKAIRLARRFDQKIVIEESVENCLEIEVSVMGNSVRDFAVSLPGRIIPAAEFYDYNDKYRDNQTVFKVPARLPFKKIKEIQAMAWRAYRIAGCEGLARVDFLLDKDQRIFLNEINTMPGFTSISMYPKLWQASGLRPKKLITKLVDLAMKRARRG